MISNDLQKTIENLLSKIDRDRNCNFSLSCMKDLWIAEFIIKRDKLLASSHYHILKNCNRDPVIAIEKSIAELLEVLGGSSP